MTLKYVIRNVVLVVVVGFGCWQFWVCKRVCSWFKARTVQEYKCKQEISISGQEIGM